MGYLSLREPSEGTLKWKKPNPQKREFQLTDGPSMLATLTWSGSLGTEAAGVTADGRWLFKRHGARNPIDLKGLTQPRVSIEPADGGDAVEVAPGSSETVNFGGENSYRWQLRPNSKTGVFTREAGEPVVTIRYSAGATDGEVSIEPESRSCRSFRFSSSWGGTPYGTAWDDRDEGIAPEQGRAERRVRSGRFSIDAAPMAGSRRRLCGKSTRIARTNRLSGG